MSPSDMACEAKKCQDPDENDEEGDEDRYGPHHLPAKQDNGRAWLVLLASCMAVMGTEGTIQIINSVSAMFFEFNGDSDIRAERALAGAYFMLGPVSAAVCKVYGPRRVTLVGSLLTSFSFVLSVWGSSHAAFFLLSGLLPGVGTSLIYLSATVAVCNWFESKRGFAVGCAMLGSSLSVFIVGRLIKEAEVAYGSREAMFFLAAGVTLNCCVCGMLFSLPDSWRQRNPYRRPVNGKVKIERGEIMKALIEHKKRERNTSHGSLDNCIITRRNEIIRIDPKQVQDNRNNSIMARLLRQLGFSSQSLASSKTSVAQAGIPSIVIDAVNRDLMAKRAAAQGRANSLKDSPVYRPSALPQLQRPSLPSTTGTGEVTVPTSAHVSNRKVEGGASEGSPSKSSLKGKTRSCDFIPATDSSHNAAEEGAAVSEDEVTSPKGMHQTRSASDLQSYTILQPLLASDLEGDDLRIQSIQLIPNVLSREHAISKAKGVRCRSSRSESSTYSFSGFSYTQPGSSTASEACLSQMSAGAMGEDTETDGEVEQSSLLKYCSTVVTTFDLDLVLDLQVFLLMLSAFLFRFSTQFALYVAVYKTDQDYSRYLDFWAAFLSVGFFLVGWLADRPWASPMVLYCASLFMCAVTLFFSPLCQSQWGLAAQFSLLGLMLASVCLRPILLIDFVGLKRLGPSFGLVMFADSLGYVLWSSLQELLNEKIQDVDHQLILAGAISLMSSVVMLPVLCRHVQPSCLEEKLLTWAESGGGGGPPIQETLTMERLRGPSECSTHDTENTKL